MKLARFQRLVDAYGADPRWWPGALREDAEAFIATDPAARAVLAEVEKLDAAIACSVAPAATSSDEDAARRVLARLGARPLPQQKRGLLAMIWPAALTNRDFTPAWPRVAALACAASLGLALGLSSLGTRIATDLDLVTVASAETDLSASVFENDAMTGLRP